MLTKAPLADTPSNTNWAVLHMLLLAHMAAGHGPKDHAGASSPQSPPTPTPALPSAITHSRRLGWLLRSLVVAYASQASNAPETATRVHLDTPAPTGHPDPGGAPGAQELVACSSWAANVARCVGCRGEWVVDRGANGECNSFPNCT